MSKNDLDPKQNNQQTREDEIDVNQLFVFIGKGFSNVFNFIGNFFKSIFKWILQQIIFIRNHFKKLILSALFFAILGGIYQYGFKEVRYQSSMTVEPNFGSSFQLYKNIDYYRSLIEQKNHEQLATSFNISVNAAKNISWIEIEPYSNENQSLISYKYFMEGLDSLTNNLIDYKTYAKKQPVESYKYHVVRVISKDNDIFEKLQQPIINSITKNTYYDKVKSTSFLNLTSRKNALLASMSEIDSLRSLYKKVLLAESAKENSGTNIFMSSTESDDKQLLVFDKYMLMNQQLIEVNKNLMEEDKVINVISSFNSIGMKMDEWYRNFTIIGFIAGFLSLYLLLIFKELNQVLIQYEKS